MGTDHNKLEASIGEAVGQEQPFISDFEFMDVDAFQVSFLFFSDSRMFR